MEGLYGDQATDKVVSLGAIVDVVNKHSQECSSRRVHAYKTYLIGQYC